MPQLASSDDFVAAARNNAFLNKYSSGPKRNDTGRPAQPAQPSNVNKAAPEANSTGNAETKPTAATKDATTQNQVAFKNNSNVAAGPAQSNTAPVSATEKMSAITSIAKTEHAVISALPALKGEVAGLSDKIDNLILAVEAAKAAAVKEPSPPPAPGQESNASEAKSNVPNWSVQGPKQKITLSEHLAANPTPTGMPPYIQGLKKYEPNLLSQTPLPPDGQPIVTFTLPFLKRVLGGEEFSPGLYFPAHSLTELLTEKQAEREERLRRAGSVKAKSKEKRERETWYAFEGEWNPYVPMKMAAHGAALTPFFHDFDAPTSDSEEKRQKLRYVDVPVFVAVPAPGTVPSDDEGEDVASGVPKVRDFAQESEYMYMGQYTQSRWSDRLDITTLTAAIPLRVLRHWAVKLSSKTRAQWVTEALMNHLETKPAFEPEGGSDQKLLEEVKDFQEEVELWKEDAEKAVQGLTEKEVLKLFREPDAGPQAGLRFWWEYLECVGFDRGFYYALAGQKKKEEGLVAEGQYRSEDYVKKDGEENENKENEGEVKSIFGGDEQGLNGEVEKKEETV